MSDEHQSFIKSPRQLIVVVVLSFLVPITIIALLATLVSTTTRTGAGADSMSPEAVAERLQPVGRLEVADAGAPTASKSANGGTASAPAAAPQAAASAPAPAQPPAGAAAAASASAEGEKIYKATCGVCHDNGVAGAPKHGDAAAWKPRLEQGADLLVRHAIDGIRAMPPRGGNATLTDQQVHDAVVYMLAAVR